MKWYIWNYNKQHRRWPHWKSITIRMELANQTKINFEIVECTVPIVVKGFKASLLRIAIETEARCTPSGPTSWVLHSRYLTAASVITGGGPCQMGLTSERSWQLSTMWVTDVQITGCGLLCELIGHVGRSCHKLIPNWSTSTCFVFKLLIQFWIHNTLHPCLMGTYCVGATLPPPVRNCANFLWAYITSLWSIDFSEHKIWRVSLDAYAVKYCVTGACRLVEGGRTDTAALEITRAYIIK